MKDPEKSFFDFLKQKEDSTSVEDKNIEDVKKERRALTDWLKRRRKKKEQDSE